jgi:hypothetical protein
MQVTALDGELRMKRAMSSRNRKRTQNLEVDAEAVKILRTVGDQEAFHFYEAVGKPTNEIARNISDFLDKVKSVKSESLTFHLQRRDFQNWIEKILGDPKLGGELGKISASNGNDVRKTISKTVENRIKELKESSVAILADENSAVLLSSS